MALDNWPDFTRRGKKLFGSEHFNELYRRLEITQNGIPKSEGLSRSNFIKPFDPIKGTRRELGLLVEFADLLRRQDQSWIPTSIVRYVYVSRYQSGKPFRMRTYLFHFEQSTTPHPEKVLADVWANSKLFFANGEGLENTDSLVGNRSTSDDKGELNVAESILGIIARRMGGAELAEYEGLLKKSEWFDQIRNTLSEGGFSPEGLPSSGENITSLHTSTPKKDAPLKKTWESLTKLEQIEWTLKALELRTQSNGTWLNGSWKKLLQEEFGHYNEKLGRSLRAVLARTSGKRRRDFEKRIKAVLGNKSKPYLERLAKIPSDAK